MNADDATSRGPEANDPDPASPEFQTVLKALVEVYRPILEEDLKRASNLQALGDEAEKSEPDCEQGVRRCVRLYLCLCGVDFGGAIVGAL